MRHTHFHQKAWGEFTDWAERDLKTFLRLVDLINEAKRTPFEGKGKPEPLKGDKKGYCGAARAVTSYYRRTPINL